jgi:hypothetical protein
MGDISGVRWIGQDGIRTERERCENTYIVQLSRVAYAPDSGRAIAYASMRSGACAEDGGEDHRFYQFQRSLDRRWRLVATVNLVTEIWMR